MILTGDFFYFMSHCVILSVSKRQLRSLTAQTNHAHLKQYLVHIISKVQHGVSL